MHRVRRCGLIGRVFAGHYAPAFVAAGASPRTPLWILLLAAQFVDVLWVLAILGGVEHAHLDPSQLSNPLVLEHMPWTHSLAGTALWSALGYAAARRVFALEPRGADLVALVIASHWFLDFLVHRPDLTLAGGPDKLGLALWNYPVAAWLLEVVLVIVSVAFAGRARAASDSARRRWWAIGGALVVLQTATSFGPLPPTLPAMVTSTLAIYLLVAAAGSRVDAA